MLLASSGPLYVVAMPLSMLAFTRVPVIRTRQYPMKAGEFIQIFVLCIPVMFLCNTLQEYGTAFRLHWEWGRKSSMGKE